MEIILFNLNDLVILLVIAQCLLLAVMLLANAKSRRDRHILAAILTCFAIDAFATLAYWSVHLNALAPLTLTMAGLWGKWAYMLLGPTLYWYASELLGRKIQSKEFALHASISLCYPLSLIVYIMTAGPGHLEQDALDRGAMQGDSIYRLSAWVLALSPLIYSLLTLRMYKHYQKTLEEQFSNIQPIERVWVKFILYGFVIMTSWHCLTLVGSYLPAKIGHWIGLTGNYGRFIFANVLVYLALEKSIVGVAKLPSLAKAEPEQKTEAALIDLTPVIQKIESEQIYLSPDLTLDELAEATKVPPRALSSATNSQLNKNFFEFINGFRVEHAKHLLVAHPRKSVQHVMEESGFSSKSAFHRFFKKITGVSPSEYRKQG